MLIPAPPGTYILHVLKASDGQLAILKHVCVGFQEIETNSVKRIVPKCLVAAGDDVIEAAVLHSTGEVSSTSRGMSFESVDSFAFTIRAATPKPAEKVSRDPEEPRPATPAREPGKPRPGMKRRSAAEVAEDAALEKDLIG